MCDLVSVVHTPLAQVNVREYVHVNILLIAGEMAAVNVGRSELVSPGVLEIYLRAGSGTKVYVLMRLKRFLSVRGLGFLASTECSIFRKAGLSAKT
jgi:putative component of toxin-antitoxin plasmid stabilization module